MPKILCVEDEEDLRQDIVEELEDAGYEVYEAENGKEALDLILTNPPDLVVSDITMPTMDGLQLVKCLRDNYPKFDEMPFIFLSALADKENILEGLSSGSDDYLTKPIDFDMLLAWIEIRLRQIGRMIDKKKNEQIYLYKEMQKKIATLSNEINAPFPTHLKASIALVGDQSKSLNHIQDLLKEQGCQVERFTSGRSYLRKVKTLKPYITCFELKTEDYDLSQIFNRCGEETGARLLVVPNEAVKNLKFILKDHERNLLVNIIVFPSSKEDILKRLCPLLAQAHEKRKMLRS